MTRPPGGWHHGSLPLTLLVGLLASSCLAAVARDAPETTRATVYGDAITPFNPYEPSDRKQQAYLERKPFPADPVRVRIAGDAARAYNSALRSLVERGFELLTTDRAAGIISARLVRRDEVGTQMSESVRQEGFAAMDAERQALALQRRDPITVPLYMQRQLTLQVTIAGTSGVILPKVVSCVVPWNSCVEVNALGNPLPLIADEAADVATTAQALGEEPPRSWTLPPMGIEL